MRSGQFCGTYCYLCTSPVRYTSRLSSHLRSEKKEVRDDGEEPQKITEDEFGKSPKGNTILRRTKETEPRPKEYFGEASPRLILSFLLKTTIQSYYC